jgi:hypothetical protein
MWLIPVFVLLSMLIHMAYLRLRDKILATLVQKSLVAQVETWVNALKNDTKYDIFAQRWDFYAELLFTEKAIIIFRMFKLGPIKLRGNIIVLAKSFDDVPSINDFWYRMHTGMLHRIDSISIDGRRVLVESTHMMPTSYWFNRFIKMRYRKFLIADLKDNDAYKNILLLQRHLYSKNGSTF